MKNLIRLLSKEGLSLTFVIFYTVGLVLYFSSVTRQLFIFIIPYTLLLTTAAVFFYHKEWNFKTIGVLFSIFISSVLIEIIGVATGKLFGVYSYGASLGFRIGEVPIIIGLNWVILVYGSHAILSRITTNSILKVAGASALMVVYDIVLEKAAPLVNMWKFDAYPPFMNYLMWFFMAVFFQSAIELFKLNTNNKPARALFIIQFFFFLVIVMYSLIFIQ